MRNIFFIIVCLVTAFSANAQNVIHGEYFIDADPGFGNGSPIIISLPDTDITESLTIPYNSFISPGYHYVYFRTLNASGDWSFTSRKLVEAEEDIGLLSIINIEYFFDADNGFGNNGSTQLIAASDSTWTFNIPYNQVPVTWTANDTLFVRVLDSERGSWSITAMIDSLNLTTGGLDDLMQQMGVSVYPSPFSDELNLILKNPEAVNARIYNVDGGLVFDKIINQSVHINTANLPSGAYIIQVNSGKTKVFNSIILKE
ncbi:MAG: T9SS type A sorting domain-containing protein [Bacteroidia bacterium]|nr:T9SS type A sorting domain-containing protein [Bacteroidia bacterium]